MTGKAFYSFRTMGPETMLAAAKQRAEALGLHAVVLASSLNDVEARTIGEALGYIATEVEQLGQPFAPPCMLILGGELVVTVGDATGCGGRNQEFVLAAAGRIAGSAHIAIASVDSEGTDGPTEAAGGIVDGETLARTQAAGLGHRGGAGESQLERGAGRARRSDRHRRAWDECARSAADLCGRRNARQGWGRIE